MDDYRPLEKEAHRSIGAVVSIWNLIDEALFLAFVQLSALPEVIAATHYGRASTISPKIRMLRDYLASDMTTAEDQAIWEPILHEAASLNGVRNDLIHSPLRWSNGRITLALAGTPDDGEIEVKSVEGRGFTVQKSRAAQLSGARKSFTEYDVPSIWAHVAASEALHERIWRALR